MITMSGNAVNSEEGILDINHDSNSADGIGIQILRKKHPVILGQPMMFISDSNSAEIEHILFSARYVIIKRKIKPGEIHSIMSIKLEYL